MWIRRAATTRNPAASVRAEDGAHRPGPDGIWFDDGKSTLHNRPIIPVCRGRVGGSHRARIAAEHPQELGRLGQPGQRRLHPRLGQVPLDVDVEDVLPGRARLGPRLELGEADALVGQDVQAADQGAPLVLGPEDQRHLGVVQRVAVLRHRRDDHEPGEVERLVGDVPGQDDQPVAVAGFGAGNRRLVEAAVSGPPAAAASAVLAADSVSTVGCSARNSLHCASACGMGMHRGQALRAVAPGRPSRQCRTSSTSSPTTARLSRNSRS